MRIQSTDHLAGSDVVQARSAAQLELLLSTIKAILSSGK
jgi:hypothetical protein